MMSADRRRRDLAAIHASAKRLGLTEDERRDIIFALTQHRSCAELDYTQLQRVRAHFEARLPARSRSHPGKPRRMDHPDTGPMMTKIEALLADQGLPWSYAHSIAKRMHRVDRLEFCHLDQLSAVMVALLKRQEASLDKQQQKGG